MGGSAIPSKRAVLSARAIRGTRGAHAGLRAVLRANGLASLAEDLLILIGLLLIAQLTHRDQRDAQHRPGQQHQQWLPQRGVREVHQQLVQLRRSTRGQRLAEAAQRTQELARLVRPGERVGQHRDRHTDPRPVAAQQGAEARHWSGDSQDAQGEGEPQGDQVAVHITHRQHGDHSRDQAAEHRARQQSQHALLRTAQQPHRSKPQQQTGEDQRKRYLPQRLTLLLLLGHRDQVLDIRAGHRGLHDLLGRLLALGLRALRRQLVDLLGELRDRAGGLQAVRGRQQCLHLIRLIRDHQRALHVVVLHRGARGGGVLVALHLEGDDELVLVRDLLHLAVELIEGLLRRRDAHRDVLRFGILGGPQEGQEDHRDGCDRHDRRADGQRHRSRGLLLFLSLSRDDVICGAVRRNRAVHRRSAVGDGAVGDSVVSSGALRGDVAGGALCGGVAGWDVPVYRSVAVGCGGAVSCRGAISVRRPGRVRTRSRVGGVLVIGIRHLVRHDPFMTVGKT